MLPELTGVIPLAYFVVIPANEIVIPTIPMLTVLTLSTPEGGEGGAGVMVERNSNGDMEGFPHAGGRTLPTGANLMPFRLLPRGAVPEARGGCLTGGAPPVGCRA